MIINIINYSNYFIYTYHTSADKSEPVIPQNKKIPNSTYSHNFSK